MRSRKSKSSAAALLIGAFVLVIGLAGAAFLLLDDGTEPQDDAANTPAVALQSAGPERSMDLPVAVTPELVPEKLKAQPVVPMSIDTTVTAALDLGAPLGRLEGVCVDGSSRPVAGVRVRITHGSPIANMTLSSVRDFLDTEATSGANGQFVLEQVPAGKNYMLVGEHDDFAPSTAQGQTVRPDETTQGVQLVLRPGATMGGSVTTVAESPIPEARVEIYDTVADARLPPDERLPYMIVFTDRSGRFEFKHIAMSSVKVRVVASGYETQTLMISSALKAGPEDQELAFRLADGREAGARVVDTSGRPVTGARVEANALKRDYQGNAVGFSDTSGYLLLEGLSAENPYQVRCTAKGFSDKTVPSWNVNDSELLFELERRLSVEGWVRNGNSDPVTSFELALMRAVPGRDPALMNKVVAFKDSQGHFVFDDLEPGSYAFEARAPGFAPTRSEVVELIRDVLPPQVQISLLRGGTLAGLVLDGNLQPLKGALVKVNENNFVDTPLLKIFESMSPSGERVVQMRTNAKGRFEFKNITPGIYQLSVKHHIAAPYVLNDVIVVDDDAGTNAELEVVMPAPAVVAGLALDANRRPLPFIRVQLSMKNGYVESVTTDDTGTFRFDNLTGGTYTLTLYPDSKDDQPINPLLKLVYAQKSMKEVRLLDGQELLGVELYLVETN